MTETNYDYCIIGAGMAGASLAAELAPSSSVLLLEAEEHPGYHATGRSAAFWEECYGGPDVVPLTQASRPFLEKHGLLTRRGALYIGREQDVPALDAFVRQFAPKGVELVRMGKEALAARLEGLRPEWCEAVWQPECADIDVAQLHADYLATARKTGAQLEVRAQLASARKSRKGWSLSTIDGRSFAAKRLINAAGAWADNVAEMAGVKPLGIRPYRRTVAQLQTAPAPASTMPLVLDISGNFYFKPESGRLWLSPHDEVPTSPCDAAPEELDVAKAIARFETVVDWDVRKVETKWAGLRSFAPDRLPVYGPDPAEADFIWFAGQGGFGIQTAPAAAALVASCLLECDPGLDVTRIDIGTFAPGRFG